MRKRCPECNADLTIGPETEGVVSSRNRWQRDARMLAQRIEASDLNHALNTGLIIEADTLALIFQNGEFKATVTGGSYSFATAKSGSWRWPWSKVRLDQIASVVLVSAGVNVVAVTFDESQTAEGVPVKAYVQLAVQVRDPMAVFKNLMQGQTSVSLDDFADQLRGKLDAIVASQLQSATLDQVMGDMAMHQRLEAAIQSNAGRMLHALGLDVIEVRAFKFEPRGEAYQQLLRAKGERYALGQKVDDLESKYDIQRRGEMLRARRQSDEIRDKSGLHEETEADAFHRVLKTDERTGTIDSARRERAETEAERERAEQRRQVAHKLDTHATLKDHERSQNQAEVVGEAGIRDVRRQIEGADFEERQRQLRAKVDLASTVNGLRTAEGDRSERLRLEREAIASELKQKELAAAAGRELDRVRALSEVEQARLAADLRKTEALAGFSEGQIVALFAKDSPEVANALAEKFRAEAATRQGGENQQLYERLLATSSENMKNMQQFMAGVLQTIGGAKGDERVREREHADEIKSMAGDAMDRMADVAAGAARRRTPPEAAAPATCPRCQASRDADSTFCKVCGYGL
jgi:hypothetical protein